MRIKVIILAAGRGVRMNSSLPKVFHNLCGKPILSYVLETALSLNPEETFVVVGHKSEIIKKYFSKYPIKFVNQEVQLGTAHAVAQVEPYLKNFNGTILILAGDMPLISRDTIKELISVHQRKGASATVLTAEVEKGGSFGRIVRSDSGEILKIVEHKDATPNELKINEINTGIYCFKNSILFDSLKEIKPENVQKEYYLTDAIQILKRRGLPVFAHKTQNPLEAMGINTKEELEKIEKILSSKNLQTK